MKKILYTLLLAGLCFSASSCFKEDIPQAGTARHEVTEPKGIPGDEEATISWTMPEGWNPTDFLVTYTTTAEHKELTGGAMQYTVTGLNNGDDYIFSVQAVYGDIYSNPVKVTVKPATERFKVDNLVAESSDRCVTLTWKKPSTGVLSYSLTWFLTEDESTAKTVEVDADKETVDITELTNDKSYTFTLVAKYKKGDSEPVTVKATPALAIPFFVSRTKAAAGQPITFTFNREGYPTATDVKWIFPDAHSLSGDEVTERLTFGEKLEQTVILSANIKGHEKKWDVNLEIREYVVEFNTWETTDTKIGTGIKGSCPVFSPDRKTVYELSFSAGAGLYAFDTEEGTLKWMFIPEGNRQTYNPLTVNPVTRDIYFGTTTAGQFFAIGSDGSMKWKFTEAGKMNTAAPAVNKAGSEVYIGDGAGNIFAIDAASGTKKWGISTGSGAAAMLVNGDEIVVGCVDGTVKFLKAADGTENASIKFAAMTATTGFAVAPDNNTVYLPLKKALGSFNLKTREIIKSSFTVATNDMYEPIVSPNGDVFVGSKDGFAYCIDKDLTTIKWKFDSGVGGNAFNFSRPCVDKDGNFYITHGQKSNTTFVLAPDGTVKDSWSYGSTAGQKQMGGNNLSGGVLYCGFVGSKDDYGALIGKYIGAERAPGWSSHGGDICGSCCVK